MKGLGWVAARTAVAATAGGTISAATGGKFANGARTAAFGHLYNQERARARSNAQKGDGFFKRLWKKATGWHFEGRDARNGNLPTYDQATGRGSQWQQLSADQSVFHDNGVGEAELKFIHPGGREVVFDSDTRQIITNDQYRGTYNYVNPAPVPTSIFDVGGAASYIGRGAGHLLLDVAPYALGGNARGPD